MQNVLTAGSRTPSSTRKPMKPCSKCGTLSSPLYGEQLCRGCFRIETGQSPHSYTRRSMKLSDDMSKDDLERQYVNEGMSLEDIATRCKCSRQYILKLLRRYRIPRRNKSAARILATSKGKITVMKPFQFCGLMM